MKTLKQLAIVALLCYGASAMAMNSAVRTRVDNAPDAEFVEIILGLSDGEMYHLLNLGTEFSATDLPPMLNTSSNYDWMAQLIYNNWEAINDFFKTIQDRLYERFSAINSLNISQEQKNSLQNKLREATEKIRVFVVDRSLKKANDYAQRMNLPKRALRF
jgi:hypothetical protein